MTQDITKLPKWAQTEIGRITANLRRAQERLNEMTEGDEPTVSNVVLPYFRGDMHDQYLPKDQHVRFLLPHPWAETRPGHIEVNHVGPDFLDIHGSTQLWIEPWASNCFKVRLRGKD